MSFLNDCQSVEVSQFMGAWLPETAGIDATKVPLNHGLSAKNVQYFGDAVSTRLGHSTVFSPGNIIASMVNWLFISSSAPKNYLAYYTPGTGVRIADLSSPTATTAVTETTGTAASMLPYGARLYCAFMDANCLGVAPPQVYGFGVGADPMFAPPVVSIPTASAVLYGAPVSPATVATPGVHNVGYLLQTRNGYTTKPCPVVADVFTPVQATVPADGNSYFVSMEISATFPAYVTGIIPIMTTAANPAQYFIPAGAFGGNGSVFPVASGANDIIMNFYVSDQLLASTGTDATVYFNQLSEGASGTRTGDVLMTDVVGHPTIVHWVDGDLFDVSMQGSPITIDGTSYTVAIVGSPTSLSLTTNSAGHIDPLPYSASYAGANPIQPFAIVPYGQRLVYLCLDSAGIPVAYASDSSAPQSINAATSGVYLPGNLPMTNAFSLLGVLYITGPHWTYSTTDSGTVPAEWPEPQLVDGKVGSAGPFAIALNTSQNYAWVADQSGLYVFSGGSYTRPVSYYQNADWSRINFACPACIQVADDSTSNRVHVIAPLDGATSPTNILTWDYTNGQDAENAKYEGAATISGYALGAIAMVQNNTTKHIEKWIAPSSGTNPIGRENTISDTNPFRDFAAAIDSAYETALMPQGNAGNLIMAHAARMRIFGAGSLQVTAYSLDHASSVGPFSITLSSSPGMEILQRFFLMNEYVSLLFEINVLDKWFQLSRVDLFYTLGSPQR